MAIAQTDKETLRKPLRLWPGVVAAVLLWLIWYVVPLVVPGTGYFGPIGGVIGGLVVVVRWVPFSRAPWPERLGSVVLMVAGLCATSRILHESIGNAGQGMLFYICAIPVLSLALVAWAVASRRLADGPRRAALAATMLLACGGWALLRTDGTSSAGSDFAWRWSKTPEERLLAQAGDEPVALAPAPALMATAAEWPGFRGPDRNGIIPGARIATDWSASPPVELWRRKIGPGWSSFAVHGDLLYTQEQRGEDEIVACYRATDGGQGQLVLLADQDVLLVISEKGELALVQAAPEEFTELARFKAIEGKTWNHPGVGGDLLWVRNDQEMAAFRLSL